MFVPGQSGPSGSPTTTVRAARRASSRPHLAAVLREGRKSANIYASLGFIRGIPVKRMLAAIPTRDSSHDRAGLTGINQNINSSSGQLTAHDSPRLESRKENSIGFLRLALAAMVIYTH